MRSVVGMLLWGAAIGAVLFLVLDFCGFQKLFGYEIQLDRNSGQVRRIEYRVVLPDLVVRETNAISEAAGAMGLTTTPDWMVVVRRPLLRRKPEHVAEAALLPALKIASAIASDPSLSDSGRSNFVVQWLWQMRTNSPKSAVSWVDQQWQLLPK